jgi:hypothetical protein
MSTQEIDRLVNLLKESPDDQFIINELVGLYRRNNVIEADNTVLIENAYRVLARYRKNRSIDYDMHLLPRYQFCIIAKPAYYLYNHCAVYTINIESVSTQSKKLLHTELDDRLHIKYDIVDWECLKPITVNKVQFKNITNEMRLENLSSQVSSLEIYNCSGFKSSCLNDLNQAIFNLYITHKGKFDYKVLVDYLFKHLDTYKKFTSEKFTSASINPPVFYITSKSCENISELYRLKDCGFNLKLNIQVKDKVKDKSELDNMVSHLKDASNVELSCTYEERSKTTKK